jgi:16S rRNA (guanine527-N7)-methyltransferase
MDQILHYFPKLTELQIKQFEQLQPLYAFWNEQINVISRKDFEHFYEHHVLHSLGIAKMMNFQPNSKIMDVGTGGGFPGIPLAILFPECQFYLVDSIGKKIKVVQEVANALELKNVKIYNERAENIKGQFDFIVSRAVTSMPIFLSWIQNKFFKKQINAYPNGVLYLKGGDLTEELKPIKQDIEIMHLKDCFDEEFFETKQVVYIRMVR